MNKYSFKSVAVLACLLSLGSAANAHKAQRILKGKSDLRNQICYLIHYIMPGDNGFDFKTKFKSARDEAKKVDNKNLWYYDNSGRAALRKVRGIKYWNADNKNCYVRDAHSSSSSSNSGINNGVSIKERVKFFEKRK